MPAVQRTITALALCVGARMAAAQTPQLTAPEHHVWLSADLGVASSGGGGALGLWYSRNTLLLGAEGSFTGGFLAEEERDVSAVLAGFTRGAGNHRYVAAAGLASVDDRFNCEDFCPDEKSTTHLALAFSGQAFVSSSVVGIGLETLGAVGPGRSSSITLGVSVQLGWLRSRH